MVGCSALLDAAKEDDPEFSPNAFVFWRLVRGRSGILSPLLEAAADEARSRGLTKLLTLDFLSENNPENRVLANVGFRPTEQLHEVAVPMGQAHARVRTTYGRLAARGAIPPQARLARLEPKLLPEVRRLLHLANLLNAVDFDARLSGQAATTLSPRESTVIVLHNEIIGILLMERTHDGFAVPCRWVRPGHRAGWVNVALMHSSFRRAVESTSPDGSLRFSFNSEDHRETCCFAARSGARQVASHTRWSLRIAS